MPMTSPVAPSPGPDFPLAFNGKPVAHLDAEECLGFLRMATCLPKALENLQTAVGHGLDLNTSTDLFSPFSFCLHETVQVFHGAGALYTDWESGFLAGSVLFNQWMDMALFMVRTTGSIAGSPAGQNPLHLLPSCLNEYEGYNGYQMTLELLEAVQECVSPENLRIALVQPNDAGQIPLESFLSGHGKDLVPGLLRLHKKANLTPPWRDVFQWLGELETKDTSANPLEPVPADLLAQVAAMGAPIWGDDHHGPLGAALKPESPFWPLLVSMEQKKIGQSCEAPGQVPARKIRSRI